MNNSIIKSSYLTRLVFLIFILLFQSCSDNNEEVKPTPPSNLVATAFSASQIDLTWTDNSTNETGFKIERKTGAETYAVVATIDKDVSTYSDNNLTDNTTYTYRVYSYNSAGNSPTYSNEAIGTTLKIESLSTLTTTSISAITPYSAISGGSISSDGNSSISEKGVVWSTNPNPTISLSTKTNEGGGSDSFVSSITNLNWNTQYYIRSYATNSSGTAYGNEVTFTTSIVEITTAAITNISPTAGLGGGTISDNAGSSLLSKGLVWSTSTNPTIALSTKTNEGTSTGIFQSNITSLSSSSTYYVRAYATNSFGTIYGNEVTFTTIADYSFIAIASGYSHSLAIQNNGTLWAWGQNGMGQVGDGTTINKNTPVQIGSGYSAIAGGYYHTLALKTDGTLWAWGDNQYGQIGNNGAGSVDVLTPVQIGSGYSAIAAGYYHSLALKTDGTLWAWGLNEFGQLGDATIVNKKVPVQIGSGYASISAGKEHSLALKTDGTLWAWGRNNSGQIGDGTSGIAGQKNSPVQIGTDYAVISAGYYHSLAIKTDGVLWAWGGNFDGQLGDGTTGGFITTPKQITTGYSLATTFSFHSLGIKTDGTLWSWGLNNVGQLGDGTLDNANAPKQISSGFTSITVGYYHSIALKADGTIWSWGYNQHGQLGDRTNDDKKSPVKINL